MKNKKELSERDIVTKYIIPSIEKAYQEMQDLINDFKSIFKTIVEPYNLTIIFNYYARHT